MSTPLTLVLAGDQRQHSKSFLFPGDGKGSRPGVRSKGERATIVVAKVASCA
jgi:hypothetical protein